MGLQELCGNAMTNHKRQNLTTHDRGPVLEEASYPNKLDLTLAFIFGRAIFFTRTLCSKGAVSYHVQDEQEVLLSEGGFRRADLVAIHSNGERLALDAQCTGTPDFQASALEHLLRQDDIKARRYGVAPAAVPAGGLALHPLTHLSGVPFFGRAALLLLYRLRKEESSAVPTLTTMQWGDRRQGNLMFPFQAEALHYQPQFSPELSLPPEPSAQTSALFRFQMVNVTGMDSCVAKLKSGIADIAENSVASPN